MPKPKWQNIVCQIAEVGVNCLPLFLALTEKGDSAAASKEYHLGNVMWFNAPGGIAAYNAGDTEIGLNYAVSFTNADGVDETENVYQPLAPKTYYSAMQDIINFKDGQLCLSSTTLEEAGEVGAGTRVITAAIASLAFAAAWQLFGGIEITAEKRQEGNGWYYFLSIKCAYPLTLFNIRATAQDARGNRLEGTGEIRRSSALAAGEQVWEVLFPPGTNLEPGINHVSVQLEVDSTSYERLTAARRRRLVKGQPHRHQK